MKISIATGLLAMLPMFLSATAAEPRQPALDSFFGSAPVLDGAIAAGEWTDATPFTGVREWVPEFSPVKDDADLALRGWVKHDAEWLYFAFDVTDDVLYGIDTERWLPKENPKAHDITREGFPWFGDEIEILLNAPNTWRGNESAEGNGASWQMVCNLTKSRLGGGGAGGLIEGEPRSDAKAWDTYHQWINSGAQKAAAKKKPAGKGYIIEWAIRFNPCVELEPGSFYTPALGERSVGLNIALGDLDTPEHGKGNFGSFHHEQWWAGAPGTRTQKNNFGTLRLMGLTKRQTADTNAYSRWPNGPPTDPGFFPIAVWLQQPRNAPRFKAAGINTFVGLWRGPTETQLADLEQAGMKLICSQNAVGLDHKDSKTIIGWMHGDEPDNAQSLGQGKGWGPPILPEKIVEDYEKLRAADPSRPVLLNLGQGVAWDNWIGRGVRRNHPEDYPEYVKGCDIASFDIYPAVHDSPEVAGKLEFVARGVERLIGWAGSSRHVWNCIECTRISNEKVKPAPDQVRAEVWMALIHGSRGLIYFVHQFKPNFSEAGLFDDAEMLAAVTAINKQIHELAPVLNSPTVPDSVSAKSSTEVPIACMVKRHGGATYVFAVSMRNQPARGTFIVRGLESNAQAEVLGESRRIDVNKGSFVDDFKPYEVRLYRIP